VANIPPGKYQFIEASYYDGKAVTPFESVKFIVKENSVSVYGNLYLYRNGFLILNNDEIFNELKKYFLTNYKNTKWVNIDFTIMIIMSITCFWP
jgi:hypothetical protein